MFNPPTLSKGAKRSVRRVLLESAEDVGAIERDGHGSLLPGDTIYEALQVAAANDPAKPAIIQLHSADDIDPQIITFADYLNLSVQAANAFRGAAGRPAIVGVIAPYMPEALIAMWGGAIAGRYLAVNPYIEIEHIAAILNAVQADVLVVASPAAGAGAWCEAEELRRRVRSVRRILVIGSGDEDDFSAVLAAQSNRLEFFPPARGTDECAFMHTGGTTATPKLVRHTHQGQLLQAWLCGTAMGSAEDDVLAHAMPNFHIGGAVAMGLRGIVFGQTVVGLTALGFRDPNVVREFWNIVRRFQITSITSAPTTAAALLAADGHGPAGLRHFTTGGGPLPRSVAERFHGRYGLWLREVWGGTEFQGILSFHYGGEVAPRLGSCGRVTPFCHVRSAILDGLRFERWASSGERGVLIACAPTTVPGYVEQRFDADFFVVGVPGDLRWATTGDIGAVDDDGFVWIYGREKDVIIRGGHNIDSALIDDVMSTHPSVLFAAAVGKPCPTRGELPMCYVQLKPGAQASEDELLAFARANVQERAAVPVAVAIVELMPLTAVGKVSKPPLRLDALERCGREVCAASGFAEAQVVASEQGGRMHLEIVAPSLAADAVLRQAFAPYTFSFSIDAVGQGASA
jgi:fatty-acyl-CoA synthase